MAEDTEPQEIVLTVRGLHCAGCVARLTRMLEHLPGVATAEVSLAHSRVRVRPAPVDPVALEQLAATIENAGFYL